VLSGLNFKRKGLQKLLNMVIHEEVDKVYVTHKDRLARFGYDLLETLFKRFGTEIV
jgi:predicted site-specific integrase-resolvase